MLSQVKQPSFVSQCCCDDNAINFSVSYCNKAKLIDRVYHDMRHKVVVVFCWIHFWLRSYLDRNNPWLSMQKWWQSTYWYKGRYIIDSFPDRCSSGWLLCIVDEISRTTRVAVACLYEIVYGHRYHGRLLTRETRVTKNRWRQVLHQIHGLACWAGFILWSQRTIK
jgi:hypothetical protein